jgi:hypothetical protein
MKDGFRNTQKLATRSFPLRGMLYKQGEPVPGSAESYAGCQCRTEWVLILDPRTLTTSVIRAFSALNIAFGVLRLAFSFF